MNLYSKLRERQSLGSPLRIGLIGAGKFGSMYLAQVPRTPGVHLAGVVDLSPAAARRNLARVGWPLSRYGASSLDDALKMGTTYVSDDYEELIAHPRIEIIIECTGNPVAAVEHCLAAFRRGKDIVNVTVEADAFCGVLLALKAQQAGVIYSLAYGDQPALVCRRISAANNGSLPRRSSWAAERFSPQLLPSRLGEFHPEPPTDPDVNLSIHPARKPPTYGPAGFTRS